MHCFMILRTILNKMSISEFRSDVPRDKRFVEIYIIYLIHREKPLGKKRDIFFLLLFNKLLFGKFFFINFCSFFIFGLILAKVLVNIMNISPVFHVSNVRIKIHNSILIFNGFQFISIPP